MSCPRLRILLRLLTRCRDWREKQAREIEARDKASKEKRQETIYKAERAIDQFYEEYNTKKERNILENKCALSLSLLALPYSFT